MEGWGTAPTYPPQLGGAITSLKPSIGLEQESRACTDPECLLGMRAKVV